MKTRNFFYFLCIATLLCACEDPKQDDPTIPGAGTDPEVEASYLTVSPSTLTFNEENTNENIVTITTNSSWEATVSSPNLKIDKLGGTATIKQLKILDIPAGETHTLTITTVPENEEQPITKEVTVKREVATPPMDDRTTIYYNDFDKEKAEATINGKYYPYLDQSDCWINHTGTGISSITYNIENSHISVRSNWSSDYAPTAKYADASGVNNLYFNQPSNSTFAIENIDIATERDFILSFGSSVNKTFANTDLRVDIGDGQSWKELKYTRDASNKWDLTTAEFSLANSIDKLYIRFTAGSTAQQLRIDDVKLTDGEASSQVITFDETPNNTIYPLAELPVYSSTDNIITHYGYINGIRVRNYTMLFDTEKHAALWVAYPLHQCYRGSSGRTEAWAADPQIATEDQAKVYSSYDGDIYYYYKNYSRGHQIPSGDRTVNNEINAQTFYASNMTPQNSTFNSEIWGSLENKVRNNICNDTIYVVTGCYFADGYATTKDAAYGSNYGSGSKSCPVPTHYYKVLLRTRDGNTGKAIGQCSPNELIAIGFWLEHRDDYPSTISANYCVSVEEIEQKTGFTFFPSVDNEVKQQCNPSDWGL